MVTFRARDAQFVRVKQDHVCEGAGNQGAPVHEAIHVGRITGDLTNSGRQIEHASVAHPMAQQVHGVSGVAQQRIMRPRVRQADQGAVVGDQLLYSRLIHVEDTKGVERLEILLQGKVQEKIEGVDAARRGNVGDGLVFQFRVL